MIWGCAVEGWWMYWTKDVECAAARQEEKRVSTKKIHGCREGGHAEGWCVTGGCQGQGEMEADDLMWRPLKEGVEKCIYSEIISKLLLALNKYSPYYNKKVKT